MWGKDNQISVPYSILSQSDGRNVWKVKLVQVGQDPPILSQTRWCFLNRWYMIIKWTKPWWIDDSLILEVVTVISDIYTFSSFYSRYLLVCIIKISFAVTQLVTVGCSLSREDVTHKRRNQVTADVILSPLFFLVSFIWIVLSAGSAWQTGRQHCLQKRATCHLLDLPKRRLIEWLAGSFGRLVKELITWHQLALRKQSFPGFFSAKVSS